MSDTAPQFNATPTPNGAPKSIAELMPALVRHAQERGDKKAINYVDNLRRQLQERPTIADDIAFQARVQSAILAFERGGVAVEMSDHLRHRLSSAAAADVRKVATKAADGKAADPDLTRVPQANPPTPPLASQSAPASSTPQAPQAQGGQQAQTTVRAASPLACAMASIYAALRPPAPATPPQWETPPPPLGDRLRAYEQRRADQATQQMTHEASKLGAAAQRALEVLGSGPGSAVLNQIKQAAQGEPGGIRTVLSEMQPGGRYADLRSAFNASLVQERAFAAAYDKVVSGIASYARARLKLDDAFAARKMDVTALNRQFETMDKAISAAESLPGRQNGKSVHEEIAEKAARVGEFLKSVAQRFRTALAPGTTPAQTLNTSPAMAP